MQIDQKYLKKLCRDQNLYSTPELNDKLYLHYKGFPRIENLEAYTGLKVLYFEGNGFSRIEGLDHQPELRSLYLQENLIETIENLSNVPLLHTLNLNQNQIDRIEFGKLSPLKNLNTLLLSQNRLRSLEALKGLIDCPSISVLDISRNHIEDIAIVDLLEECLPNLRVLYLKENPVVSQIPSYRKTIISRLKNLTYLDERPVDNDERRTSEAWARGGSEAEREERKLIRSEQESRELRNFQLFEDMIARARLECGLMAKEHGTVDVAENMSASPNEILDVDSDDDDQMRVSSPTSAEASSSSTTRKGKTTGSEVDVGSIDSSETDCDIGDLELQDLDQFLD